MKHLLKRANIEIRLNTIAFQIALIRATAEVRILKLRFEQALLDLEHQIGAK